jgi:hypothetical protein
MKSSELRASELRVGNITTLGVVSLIDQDVFRVVDSEGDSFKNTWAEIKPIPLTEEWLLKFGFEINRQTKEENNIWRCYSEEGFFEVEQIGSSFFLDDNHCYGTKINHVHQLQNLYFALTGEELKDKNDER